MTRSESAGGPATVCRMRIASGQEWELPLVRTDDPLVMHIVEVVDDEYAVVHTFRRSAPTNILDRSTMWLRNVIDTGVLVAGPGALDARRRRERVSHHKDLLLYVARGSGSVIPGGDVQFDGEELVALVAQDDGVTRAQAQALLRDALAALAGREIASPRDGRVVGYIIPMTALEAAA